MTNKKLYVSDNLSRQSGGVWRVEGNFYCNTEMEGETRVLILSLR